MNKYLLIAGAPYCAPRVHVNPRIVSCFYGTETATAQVNLLLLAAVAVSVISQQRDYLTESAVTKIGSISLGMSCIPARTFFREGRMTPY